MNRTITTLAARTFAALSLGAAAWANPQLEVRINNQVIPDFSTHTFPDTLVGESSPAIVVIRNVGSQDLVFTENPAVQLAGAFPGQFSLIQPPLETGAKLSPNSSTAFRIDFVPDFRSANLSATLFIYTNQQAAPYRMTVRGKSVAPLMRVEIDGATIADGGTFDFGNVEIGQSVQADVIIRNQGDGLLRLTGNPRASLIGDIEGLTVTQQPNFTVAPGAATLARIRYAPTGETSLAALLIMPASQNDAEVNGEFDLAIFGRGVPATTEDEQGDDADDNGDIDDTNDSEDSADQDVDPNQPADFDDEGAEDINEDAADDRNADNDDVGFEVEDREEEYENERDDRDRDDNGFENDVQDDAGFDDDFDDNIEDRRRVASVGLCGFGIGFASLASMLSLGGMKTRRRR